MMKILRLVIFLALLSLPAFAVAAPTEKRLDTLEQQFKAIQESGAFNNKRLAEALAQFDNIKEEMAALRGQIESMQHTSIHAADKHREELQKMGYQINRLDDRFQELNLAVQDVAAFKGKESASKQQAAQRLLYEEAFSELTQKNYTLARKLFTQYLKKYPKGDLVDNAQYWIGETFFAIGDYEKAILEFQKVIEKYPKGKKRPAAILKQGYAFMELKAYADAQAFFQLILEKYPNSPEAIHAKERLTEVKDLMKEASRSD